MLCLRVPTDPGWVDAALADTDAVLIDHAHCEMKAATNALSLVVRHPGDLGLVRALTDLAKEEIEHFQRVVGFLERRGLSLGPPPVDFYAAELRKVAGELPREPSLPAVVDRLLVGALIEARSCERFHLLVNAMKQEGERAELLVFYEELFAAEAKHYRTYVDLAKQAAPGHSRVVDGRLAALSELEGRIIGQLAHTSQRATVHG
jgi:tRNA-(ms[2]io[6]A)-hydroxylase